MIVQIIGIAGSGKSYICSRLINFKNITCIDTDEYFIKAYNVLKSRATDEKIAILADKLFQNDIKKISNKGNAVVITGHTLTSKTIDNIYFIKMTSNELEQAYRRVIKRELLKYIELTDKEVINKIETMNPNKIQTYLYYKYFMGVDPLIMTFNKYKEKYDKLLKKQDSTVLIMSQANIIKSILKKLKNNILPIKGGMEFKIENMSDEIQAKINDEFYKYQIETTGPIEYKTVVFTARQNNELIGVLTAIIKWGQLHIKTLIVDSTYRKHGIGSQLMQQTFNYGRDNGCTIVYVETSSFQAPDFYKKIGFVVEFIRDGYKNGYSYYYLKYNL